MNPDVRSFSVFVIISLLFVPHMRAQENPLNDPDLKEMLKQAQEMQKQASELQKQNPRKPETKKKLAKSLWKAKEKKPRQEKKKKPKKKKWKATPRKKPKTRGQ